MARIFINVQDPVPRRGAGHLARVCRVVDRANDDGVEILKRVREIERYQRLIFHDQNAISR